VIPDLGGTLGRKEFYDPAQEEALPDRMLEINELESLMESLISASTH
jgi:hypothetical protein